MTRPLAYAFQEDDVAINKEEEFLLGDNMLICPVSEPNPKAKFMYLPAGEWYDYHTGQKYKGAQDVEIPVTIETIPVLLKGGSVLPLYPVQQYVGEKTIEEVTLKVYIGGTETTSYLYEDRGNGKEHRNGKFNYRNFKTINADKLFRVTQHVQRGYQQEYNQFRIELVGLSGVTYTVYVDDQKVNVLDHAFTVDQAFNEIEVRYK